MLTQSFAALLGLGAYSLCEADTLAVEHLRVPLENLERPLRVAQLTDIHWDERSTVGWALLEQVVARVNRESVDLVVLTGDYVSASPNPIHALAPLLGTLRSRLGTFAVLGNHDNIAPHSRPVIRTALERQGIAVLENTWTAVEGLVVGGVGDFWYGPYEPGRIFGTRPAQRPLLLLSHNPDSFWELTTERIDLQLSGHTHGGQVIVPGLGALLGLHPDLTRTLMDLVGVRPPGGSIITSSSWSGQFRSGTNRLYVSRGLGRYLRLSLACPPELTLIDLMPG
jgi:hypothetical protein